MNIFDKYRGETTINCHYTEGVYVVTESLTQFHFNFVSMDTTMGQRHKGHCHKRFSGYDVLMNLTTKAWT